MTNTIYVTICDISYTFSALRWRHTSITTCYFIHNPINLLVHGLIKLSNKSSKLRITDPFLGTSPVDYPHKGTVMWKVWPCHDVIVKYLPPASVSERCSGDQRRWYIRSVSRCQHGCRLWREQWSGMRNSFLLGNRELPWSKPRTKVPYCYYQYPPRKLLDRYEIFNGHWWKRPRGACRMVSAKPLSEPMLEHC